MKIGVLLAGSGVFDGSEIHEATLTLLHLSKAGVEAVCLAPDTAMADVIDHSQQKPLSEKRNILQEAARIARGNIRAAGTLSADELDGLIVPGGFGAAKNLSDFAFQKDPVQTTVQRDVQKLIDALYAQKKPLGFICISPASVAAPALKNKGIQLTTGNDPETLGAIRALGHVPVEATVHDIVIDKAHNVVSTPAYMLAQNIAEAEDGISKLVAEVIARAKDVK